MKKILSVLLAWACWHPQLLPKKFQSKDGLKALVPKLGRCGEILVEENTLSVLNPLVR